MDKNLIYGHHPVVEAINSGKPVEKVYFQQGIRGELEKEIRLLTRERMVRGQHQGVVAYLSLITWQSLEDVIPFVFESGEVPLIVLLDNITDVRNFGAICRTAYCAGAHAVVVPQSGSAPANEEAMKASAGALAHVRLCRVRSMFSAVELLQEAGIQVVGTGLSDRAIPVFKADLTVPTAILMGAEGEGLPHKLQKMSDVLVKVPQANQFDSYNVGVATGMILYETLRQRGRED
jgi:23S rRNA (guanosine2251-2'-O)-methyltransferase